MNLNKNKTDFKVEQFWIGKNDFIMRLYLLIKERKWVLLPQIYQKIKHLKYRTGSLFNGSLTPVLKILHFLVILQYMLTRIITISKLKNTNYFLIVKHSMFHIYKPIMNVGNFQLSLTLYIFSKLQKKVCVPLFTQQPFI